MAVERRSTMQQNICSAEICLQMTSLRLIVVILLISQRTTSDTETERKHISRIIKRSPLELDHLLLRGVHEPASVDHLFLESMVISPVNNLVTHIVAVSPNSIHPYILKESNVFPKYKIGNVPDKFFMSLPLVVQNKLPHAISSSSKTAIHNTISHIVTKDNVKIPVIVQKISHHQSNISHTPVKPTFVVPLMHPSVIGHIPLSHSNHIAIHKSVPVISKLPHAEKLVKASSLNDKLHPALRDYNDNQFRKPIGGYGVGYDSGGSGAGHGYWVNTYFVR